MSKIIGIAFVFLILALANSRVVESRRRGPKIPDSFQAINCRKHSAVLTDFGGKGDGITSNTKAFQSAINHLSQYASDGGAQLIVPPGKWLTGSFNLTSHFTLYIHKYAVILASQDESEFPIVDPLPSYGRGRDAPGGRYISLIFGTNLVDVVITGDNGTIDGQGSSWWAKFRELKHSRPYMIEILYSKQIQISNLNLVNSPSWHVHPVYSRDIIIQGLTIRAPVTNAPETDGIDPDSCTNVLIQDCSIVTGDDCIAIKSGWAEYGINVGIPTKQVVIRRITCSSPKAAVIAIGSEMSGGVQDVRAEDITAVDSLAGIRIKTAPGRGAYVKDIFVRRMTMNTIMFAFWWSGHYRSNPDDGYDPQALPVVHNINCMDMVAENVTQAGRLAGIEGDLFTGICLSNVTIGISTLSRKMPWSCSNVQGVTSEVSPKACSLLPEKEPGSLVACDFPEDKLPIESVRLKTCSIGTFYMLCFGDKRE